LIKSLSASVGPGEAQRFPVTEADRESVRRQLKRLLADPAFSSSKRYPKLLHYIVETTLAGRTDEIKERTLGVEVFGRDASYDTNQDPVVRTSAAQVRQRLTQYYLGKEHEAELRIELQPGSYVPQFRPAGVPDPLPPVGAAELTAEELAAAAQSGVENGGAGNGNGVPPLLEPESVATPVLAPQELARPRPKARVMLGIAALSVIAIVAWLTVRQWGKVDGVAGFWKPALDDPNPIVICVPGRFPTEESMAQSAWGANQTGPLTIVQSLRADWIAWPDATTLYALVGFVQARGKPYHVRREGDSALSDLRTGPTILIGGLDNSWLMRLTSHYRFRYERSKERGESYIIDTKNPDWRECKVRWQDPYSTFEQDCGIIARVWDPTTERVVITASGIAAYGTIAAGEILTNPKHMAMIAAQAPKGGNVRAWRWSSPPRSSTATRAHPVFSRFTCGKPQFTSSAPAARTQHRSRL
jgi:hypothetical protein